MASKMAAKSGMHMKWTHVILVLFISKLLFYGQYIVKINDMRHFIIGQVFRYKMASKMAAKIVYLNESSPKYTPVVYKLRSRSQKWEIKSYTALNIILLHTNLMYDP